MYIYSLHQDKTFKVVNVPIHLGPYAFLTRMLSLEENVFVNVTVNLLGVVSVRETVNTVLKGSTTYQLPSRNYSVDMLYGFAAGPGIDAAKRAADLLAKASVYLSEAESRLSKAREYTSL